MVRIFIADGHPVVREGIKRILADTREMCVVGEAADMPELMALASECPCDVVLLDSTLSGQSRVAAIQALKATHPELSVLVCSMYFGSHYVLEAFNAGATGYLTKDCLPEELIQAIHQVVQGKRYVSPLLADVLGWDETAEQGIGH